MAIYKGSRYWKSKIINKIDGSGITSYLSRRKKFELPVGASVIYHTFLETDTIDYLAYKYYDDSNLWWVIMDCNDKYMLPMDIPVGAVLTIPSYDTVRRVINAL